MNTLNTLKGIKGTRRVKRKNKFSKKQIVWGVVILLLLIGAIYLYNRTGIFQRSKIDFVDSELWGYDEKGVIVGAEGFEILGNRENCWLIIHSYASTPLEMKKLAEEISLEFGDYVRVPRLVGHAEVPSHIFGLSLDDWYLQVEEIFEEMNLECGKINVVGSSFGGALAVALSERENFGKLYLVNAYLGPTYRWYLGLNLEFYLDVFADLILYSKKIKVAGINDPEGLKTFVGYRNFPYPPIKNSKDFLVEIRNNLNLIDEDVLILHSKNDGVAEVEKMKKLFEECSSDKKELTIFTKSNHILLADYDKEEVINNIIMFEYKNR